MSKFEQPFEQPLVESSKDKTTEEKNMFLEALDEELSVMEESGKITVKEAEEKRKAANLIESGFSGNPKKDAKIFSNSGIATEKEMIDILEKK